MIPHGLRHEFRPRTNLFSDVKLRLKPSKPVKLPKHFKTAGGERVFSDSVHKHAKPALQLLLSGIKKMHRLVPVALLVLLAYIHYADASSSSSYHHWSVSDTLFHLCVCAIGIALLYTSSGHFIPYFPICLSVEPGYSKLNCAPLY